MNKTQPINLMMLMSKAAQDAEEQAAEDNESY